MTESLAAGEFESSWGEIAGDLLALLCRRGADVQTAEDIVQETALRIFQRWDELDHERPLFPFAVTVSLNLLRDGFRRGRRERLGDACIGAAGDVEREGLARLEFSRVAKAMRGLPTAQREILIATVADAPNELQLVGGQAATAKAVDRSPAATKMLRMRARRRLMTMLETAGVAVIAVRRRLDEFLNEPSQTSVAVFGAGSILLAAMAVPVELEDSMRTPIPRPPVPAHAAPARVSSSTEQLTTRPGPSAPGSTSSAVAVATDHSDGATGDEGASATADVNVDADGESSIGADVGAASAWVHRGEKEGYRACLMFSFGAAQGSSCRDDDQEDP